MKFVNKVGNIARASPIFLLGDFLKIKFLSRD